MGWCSWRVSSCELGPPIPPQAGPQPDREQLADVGLVPLPCPGRPQGRGQGAGPRACQPGEGRVPEGHGFAGYYPELRHSWGRGARTCTECTPVLVTLILTPAREPGTPSGLPSHSSDEETEAHCKKTLVPDSENAGGLPAHHLHVPFAA